MQTKYGKFHINKQGYYVKNIYLHNALRYNGKYMKHSINKEMLEMIADEMNHM